jgi:hypothetical protein
MATASNVAKVTIKDIAGQNDECTIGMLRGGHEIVQSLPRSVGDEIPKGTRPPTKADQRTIQV